jgi:acyl carrier protein
MDVENEVRLIIAKALKIPVEKLTPETKLEDIGAESLDVIEIVFEIEEKFDISVPFKPSQSVLQSGSAADAQSGEIPFDTIGEITAAVAYLVEAKSHS